MVGITLIGMIGACILESIDCPNDYSGLFVFNCVILFLYVLFCVCIYGKHEMNADYYQSLLNKQIMLKQRIQENNTESIDTYNKYLNKTIKKLEHQRKTMSVNDWKNYYSKFGEKDD